MLTLCRFSVTLEKMKKTDVVKHFGSIAAVAEALDLARSSVYDWGEIIPEGAAYKIQVITGGTMRVNQSFYEKNKQG